MKKIYFISGNKSKFEEAALLLKDSNIELLQEDIKLIEPKTLNQEEVVLSKAEQAFAAIKKPLIVDDTGIYFEQFKEFPGTYTKTLFQAIGFKGVENLLKGAKRTAHFKTLVCYKDNKKTMVFEGRWNGTIVKEISKMFNPDWEYNSIFVPDNFTEPLSEISLEERAKHSHRKKAFDKLKKYLGCNNA